MASTKENDNEEEQAFLQPGAPQEDVAWSREGRGPRKATRYLRLALEIAMAVVIILLLGNLVYQRIDGKQTPVPNCTYAPLHSIV